MEPCHVQLISVRNPPAAVGRCEYEAAAGIYDELLAQARGERWL